MMKHALVEAASSNQLAAAKESADWLLDAIAVATQDRKFLRGDPEYDSVLGETIIANGIVSALRAMKTIDSQTNQDAEGS